MKEGLRKFYFTYGSSMNLECLKKKDSDIKEKLIPVGVAKLLDFKPEFYVYHTNNEKWGILDIEHRKGSFIHGIVYEIKNSKLNSKIFAESHPNECEEIEIEVNIEKLLEPSQLKEKNILKCYTFKNKYQNGKNPPKKAYMQYIWDASEEFGVNVDQIEEMIFDTNYFEHMYQISEFKQTFKQISPLYEKLENAIKRVKEYTGRDNVFDPYFNPRLQILDDLVRHSYSKSGPPDEIKYDYCFRFFKSLLEGFYDTQKVEKERVHKAMPYWELGHFSQLKKKKNEARRYFLLAFIEDVISFFQYKHKIIKRPKITDLLKKVGAKSRLRSLAINDPDLTEKKIEELQEYLLNRMNNNRNLKLDYPEDLFNEWCKKTGFLHKSKYKENIRNELNCIFDSLEAKNYKNTNLFREWGHLDLINEFNEWFRDKWKGEIVDHDIHGQREEGADISYVLNNDFDVRVQIKCENDVKDKSFTHKVKTQIFDMLTNDLDYCVVIFCCDMTDSKNKAKIKYTINKTTQFRKNIKKSLELRIIEPRKSIQIYL